MDDITRNQNIVSSAPKIFAMHSEIAEKLRNESGDFHFASILRPDGTVDVYVDPGMTVVRRNDDETFDIFEIPKYPKSGTDYKHTPNVPETDTTVQKLTNGEILKEIPMEWTPFENSGCHRVGGYLIYC